MTRTTSRVGNREVTGKATTRATSTKPQMRSCLKAALRYAREGMAVLPLHGIVEGVCTCSKGDRCSQPGKHPLTLHGVKDASVDLKTIRTWFRQWPDANVGVATGAASGIVVIDVDRRNGGFASLQAAKDQHGQLPPTLTSRTGGGGQHLVFRSPRAAIRTSHGGILGPGIDVQSDGAYIVAPPSFHASGRRYRWLKVDGERRPMSKLPPMYRDLLIAAKLSARPETQGHDASPPVNEGSRNNHLTSLGGRLVRAGISGVALLDTLRNENHNCIPPLDDDEVKKIATSVERYQPNQTGDEAENIAKAFLADRMSANGIPHLLYAADGRFWHFDQTHWLPVPTRWLSGQVLKFAQAWPGRKGSGTSSLIKQVISLLEAMTATQKDPLGFDADPPPVINCANGELWIVKGGRLELRSHSAASYLRHVLPVTYDPTATCPRFDRAIAEIFAKAADPDGMVTFWHELAGYAIQTRRDIPLVLICKGGGSNGKTALMETLLKLIGPDLVVAMAVDELDKSRFMTGNLLGKLLFLDDDVKAGTKLPDGHLKRLSEAKTMSGERKFGDQFTFKARALPVLLCNNPPSLADLSYGMKRRLTVVPFDRTFNEREIDKDLFRRIWRDELSGVLNRTLSGLQRIIRRGWKLDPPQAVIAAKDQWLIEANPLPAFIDAQCVKAGKSYADDLYRAYVRWAQASGITMHQQRSSFDRNLQNLGYKVGNKGNRGKRILGLSLKSP